MFVENSPGHLRAPCQALADAGINLATLSLADTQQYGILRLIVRDWQRAKAVLEAAGFVVNVTEVLAIEVPDRPGGLADVLRAIEQARHQRRVHVRLRREAGRQGRAHLPLRETPTRPSGDCKIRTSTWLATSSCKRHRESFTVRKETRHPHICHPERSEGSRGMRHLDEILCCAPG